MKQFVVVFLLFALYLPQANAQTYLEKLRDKDDALGKITVKQSKKIDELVNGRAATPKPKSVKDSVVVKKHIDEKNAAVAANDSASATKHQIVERPRKGYGYRIQVFAGNNSRDSRNKARSIGEQLKAHFPGHRVYVHFYSPRWICRMGNYKTRAEANAMLQRVKDLGYYRACLVRGKL